MAKGVDIKILGTILTAVLMLSACSRYTHIPSTEKHHISFLPHGASLTKASQNLGHDKQFGVYAFYADCPGDTDWNDPLAWARSSLYFQMRHL